MSDIRFNRWLHQSGTGGVYQDSTGRVGIGTSVPTSALDVQSGTIKIGNNTLSSSGVSTFSSGIVISAGTTAAPSISPSGDSNTGIFFPAADTISASTGGTSRIVVDASGNVNIDSNTLYVDATNNRVGIGTTSPAATLDISGNQLFSAANAQIQFNAGGPIIRVPSANTLAFLTDSTTERARIDSSGRLLVGTSSATGEQLLIVQGYAGIAVGNAEFGLRRGGNPSAADQGLGAITFQNNSGNSGARIEAISAGSWTSGSNHRSYLTFSTTADGASSPTERVRISQNGTTRFFGANPIVVGTNAVADASSANAILSGRYSATSTTGSGTDCVFITSNGNLYNTNGTYGTISDVKLKENIVDADSQWSDVKALQVRNFNFKEGQTHRQIGFIAQEVEQVSPGLVSKSPDRDEDGNETGEVTKQVNLSVLYIKAVKALQEAMERIEALEARLTAAGIE